MWKRKNVLLLSHVLDFETDFVSDLVDGKLRHVLSVHDIPKN